LDRSGRPALAGNAGLAEIRVSAGTPAMPQVLRSADDGFAAVRRRDLRQERVDEAEAKRLLSPEGLNPREP
jgi:hypothetical protein